MEAKTTKPRWSKDLGAPVWRREDGIAIVREGQGFFTAWTSDNKPIVVDGIDAWTTIGFAKAALAAVVS